MDSEGCFYFSFWSVAFLSMVAGLYIILNRPVRPEPVFSDVDAQCIYAFQEIGWGTVSSKENAYGELMGYLRNREKQETVTSSQNVSSKIKDLVEKEILATKDLAPVPEEKKRFGNRW